MNLLYISQGRCSPKKIHCNTKSRGINHLETQLNILNIHSCELSLQHVLFDTCFLYMLNNLMEKQSRKCRDRLEIQIYSAYLRMGIVTRHEVREPMLKRSGWRRRWWGIWVDSRLGLSLCLCLSAGFIVDVAPNTSSVHTWNGTMDI